MEEREDFWARALHLLACSGTRHIHPLRCRGRSVPLRQRRFPPHTAVSLWRYLLLLPRPSPPPPPPPPPILPTSLLPLLRPPTPRPTTRHTRSISPRSVLPLFSSRGNPLPCSPRACHGFETGTRGSQSLADFDRTNTIGPCSSSSLVHFSVRARSSRLVLRSRVLFVFRSINFRFFSLFLFFHFVSFVSSIP